MAVEMQFKILCPAIWYDDSGNEVPPVIDNCQTALNGEACPNYKSFPDMPDIDLSDGRRQLSGACYLPRPIIAERIGLPQLIHIPDEVV